MISKYLGESAGFFQAVGAALTVYIAFKVAISLFRFIAKHFLSGFLSLPANLKKAGSWAGKTL